MQEYTIVVVYIFVGYVVGVAVEFSNDFFSCPSFFNQVAVMAKEPVICCSLFIHHWTLSFLSASSLW